LFSAAVHAGADGVVVKTYFQANELEPFLVQSLDLATFRNSLSPRHHETHQPFAMLAIAPTKILPGRVAFDGDVWCSPLPVIRHAEAFGYPSYAKKSWFRGAAPLAASYESPGMDCLQPQHGAE
jgi:hypothetical protein